NRCLKTEIAYVLLISQNRVGRVLRLVLVQLCRIKCRSGPNRVDRCQPGSIGNLEIAVVAADQEGQPTRRIENVRNIAEQLVLIRVIMNWIAAARRIFNANAIVQITFVGEIAEFSRHSTVLQAFLDRVETSDIQRSFALLKYRAILGI